MSIAAGSQLVLSGAVCCWAGVAPGIGKVALGLG